MSSAAERGFIPHGHVECLRAARSVLRHEADALNDVADGLDTSFAGAVDLILAADGHVVVSGMGKAGLIGRKIAATLSSTGTRSYFLHPAEAVHGDMGSLHRSDVVLALSNSGETEEICRLTTFISDMRIPVIAVTARKASTLGAQARTTIAYGQLREAGLFGLAPTTTTTTMLAIGDALALVLSQCRGFSPRQFAAFHPGGSLGAQLRRVADVMRKSSQLRIDSQNASIRAVYQNLCRPGRRTGAIMLTDDAGRLRGLFTDSDLARLLEQRQESQLDRPIAEVMTHSPYTIQSDALLTDAVELLRRTKVSELSVVDDASCPVGLLDITDVIGLMPSEFEANPQDVNTI